MRHSLAFVCNQKCWNDCSNTHWIISIHKHIDSLNTKSLRIFSSGKITSATVDDFRCVALPIFPENTFPNSNGILTWIFQSIIGNIVRKLPLSQPTTENAMANVFATLNLAFSIGQRFWRLFSLARSFARWHIYAVRKSVVSQLARDKCQCVSTHTHIHI